MCINELRINRIFLSSQKEINQDSVPEVSLNDALGLHARIQKIFITSGEYCFVFFKQKAEIDYLVFSLRKIRD